MNCKRNYNVQLCRYQVVLSVLTFLHSILLVVTYFDSLTALPDFSYQKVSLRGRWDHAKTILVGPRVRDGANGYNVITPLVRDNGSTILVDRGFVSEEHASVDKLKELPSDTEVEVLGMLRMSGKRNRFTPDNHPEKGEWYWVDVNAMADYAGGESAGVQPVFVEEIFGMYSGNRLLPAPLT